MVKVLLAILGCLLVAVSVYSLWSGLDLLNSLSAFENEVAVTRRNLGAPGPRREERERTIAEAKQKIEENTRQGRLQLGMGIAGLLVGGCFAVLSTSTKRKAAASLPTSAAAPPQNATPTDGRAAQ